MSRISEILQSAKAQGREALFEHEGMALLAELGISLPYYALIQSEEDLQSLDLNCFAGQKLVVKVVSDKILHKSDVGGVLIVDKAPEALGEAIATITDRFAGYAIEGVLVAEFVPYDAGLGNELLLGLRYSPDFGPIVSLSQGGIYTEFLAQNFKAGTDVAVLSPRLPSPAHMARALDAKAITKLLFGGLRAQKARIDKAVLMQALEGFLQLAKDHVPADISEFEVNPLVVSDGRLVALDALCKLGEPVAKAAPAKPLHKLDKLLKPQSVAVIGVSEKSNPGHIIVNNLLREGFDPSKIYVIKKGRDSILGCACVPSVEALPERVDLFVDSVSAEQTPDLLQEIIKFEKAESIVVIPGGLGETAASKPLAARMQKALEDSRASDWQGPLINGGNCLGVRSKPGHFDTMFIPEYKLPPTDGPVAPLAFISQSGALAVARASKLASLNPRYILSIGNQMDLTVGDYLSHLKDDPELQVFACYVEGFKPGDGGKWLDAAAEISASGRTVILYRAGRTAAGQKASASHTASVAGDYTVTRELAKQAGVVVAESLSDFEDLIRTFTLLRDKEVKGPGLGAISNAGFECVGFGDNIRNLHMVDLSDSSLARLADLLEKYKLRGIVEAHNPLDLTPMLGDAGYQEVVQAVLDDPGVDLSIVGCVPLTPALNSLAKGEHHEDLSRQDSIVGRLAQVFAESRKPWVVVVDGGQDYDAMRYALDAAGVPTFDTADRAMAALEAFYQNRRGD